MMCQSEKYGTPFSFYNSQDFSALNVVQKAKLNKRQNDSKAPLA